MSDTSIEDKVKIASEFLLSSPPGEVNDVFNDVRVLVNDDKKLQDGILETLEQYNTEQHITVESFEKDYEIIVSKYGKIGEDRYLDPRSNKTFKFDHMRLAASDWEEYQTEVESDNLRAAIEKECLSYVNDHFPNGVCTVYSAENQIAIAIVSNKYQPKNLWNGRWRASWTYNTQSGYLKGDTKVNVHYYEDGNVQLNAENRYEHQMTKIDNKNQFAKSLIEEISKFDESYHKSMNQSYEDLSDSALKGLRRALPMTKQKINWNQIGLQKIAKELNNK